MTAIPSATPLNALKVIHCDKCGDSYYDSGFSTECPLCKLELQRQAKIDAQNLAQKLSADLDAAKHQIAFWRERIMSQNSEMAYQKHRADSAESRLAVFDSAAEGFPVESVVNRLRTHALELWPRNSALQVDLIKAIEEIEKLRSYFKA